MTNHKIDGFVLYGQKRKNLPERERFVWSDDGKMAWIIKRDDQNDIVLTTLTRAGHSRRIAR